MLSHVNSARVLPRASSKSGLNGEVVDIYGVPTAKRVPADGNRFTIDGRFQTYYYEVKR